MGKPEHPQPRGCFTEAGAPRAPPGPGRGLPAAGMPWAAGGDQAGRHSRLPGNPIHTPCLSAPSFLEGLERKTTKTYQDESAQHFFGPHFIWGIHTCTLTPSHVPPTAPGTNATSPGYLHPLLPSPAEARDEALSHLWSGWQYPGPAGGTCFPWRVLRGCSTSPAWRQQEREPAVGRATAALQAPAVSGTQHPEKMPKRVLFTHEEGWKGTGKFGTQCPQSTCR